MIRLAGILLTLLCWLSPANAQTFPGGVPNAFILTNPQGFPLPYTAGDLTATGNCNAATDYLVKFDAGTGTLQKVSCGQIAASTSSGVVGQNPSVIGQIGVWGNTVGTLLLSTDLGAIPYLITGGTTALKDQDRWNYDATPAADIGVDCTNVADSTSAIQTWATAHVNGGHLRFPQGCKFFTTDTITVTSGYSVVFDSETPAGQVQTVSWEWHGTDTTKYVLDFEAIDHPTVQNIGFSSPGGANCPGGFLKFDGNPTSHIGTAGHVYNNAFSNGNCNNPLFVAVNISPTATNNHENYIVDDNVFFCSGSDIYTRASDVVTNSSTTITSASNPWLITDVGQRIRLSFDNNSNPGNVVGQTPPFSRGYFDTTIAGFTNAGQVTLAAAVPFTQNPVHMALGQSYGTAIKNGASQNAIQQQFKNYQATNCAYGVFVAGGGVQVTQPSGSLNDIGIFFGGFRAQNSTVDYYASENDYIAFIDQPGAAAPAAFTNSRLSNAQQAGHGFLQLGGFDNLANNLVDFGLPNTNSVLIGPYSAPGISALGTVVPGSGYVPGTYTNVPLSQVPASKATIVVAGGGGVSTVTITDQGRIDGYSVTPGTALTTPNSNLGGTGSGFSVPLVATASPTTTPFSRDQFGSISSSNNDWQEGCCGSQITYARVGLDQFATAVGAFRLSDHINDTTANISSGYNFPCGNDTSAIGVACLEVNSLANQSPGQPYGVGIQSNVGAAVVTSGDQIGFRATGLSGAKTWTAFQGYPGVLSSGTTQTMFDAAWNGAASVVAGSGAAYGFRAETPTSINGTLSILYGFECDKQKITNVTASWCFNNADAADQNFFAGPTMLGNNTLTVPAGGLGLSKITADGVAAGAAGGKIELVCGSNAGSAKLIAYAGTSSTPVTILDNIGSGVTGC